MSLIGNERSAVQNPIIKYAQEVGWTYIDRNESLRIRGGESGFVFRQLFIDQIQKLNSDFMDHLLAEDIIKQLERIPTTIEGNLIAWEYFRGLKTLYIPSQKRERNVMFIDKINIDRNIFQVTDEFSFTNGNKPIRPDIIFLINGVPVFIIETKAAHKLDGIAEALDQVRRYHRECPELAVILQVYTLTHLIHYYYGATWNTSRKYLFNWKEELEQPSDKLEKLVKTFFDKQRTIRMIHDYILFTRQDDELQKVILRPHQMRAVSKVVERAEDTDKKRGLFWHTQGSGKTYSMIVAAQKLIENPLFDNPTVIMLVDRNELEAQLYGNLSSVGIERMVVADSKKHLEELFEKDTRGLIVTMIHKFEGIKENANIRKNIFILVDEAHRTTGGKLGNYLMGALPNATYLGFTGTPIDQTAHGKGTFLIFGKDDPPNGYTDKYSIAESIEDGTTVKLHYTLAPNDLLVDKETLEKEFFALAELEGVSDIDELNKVLEKAVTLINMIKNRERIQKVAKHIVDHYKQNVEPLDYKAFVVAVDREACAFYKQELDKYLPEEYSKVIYSRGYNDSTELEKYHLSDDQEKRIRKDFRNPEKLPKILIVTEKLLTGFDAPILYCMYLDKPMRDHVLLQAIARVNRPYEDEHGKSKPSGFVLDYIGIFENLEKALAYDSQDIDGIVNDIELLKEKYKQLIERAKTDYLSIIKSKTQDKAVEIVLEYFMDEEIRHAYYEFYKELEQIYDIISPDSFLRPYIEDMENLFRIYRILREAYNPSPTIDREFSRKVAKLVQEHTESGQIKAGLEVYEINEDILKKIEGDGSSDTEKIFNLIRSIEKLISDEALKTPYLISIGDKAEEIIRQYKQRQYDTQQTLEALKKLIEAINEARKEQAEKNMPIDVFSVFWILKHEGVDNPEENADQMRAVFEMYPHYNESERHERSVKQKLCGVLFKSGIKDTRKVMELTQKIMRVLKGK